MQREPGYYWVEYNGKWIVCEWENDEWFVPGMVESASYAKDGEFSTINENRILSPDEKLNKHYEGISIDDMFTPEGTRIGDLSKSLNDIKERFNDIANGRD